MARLKPCPSSSMWGGVCVWSGRADEGNCRSLGCAPTAGRGRRDDKGERGDLPRHRLVADGTAGPSLRFGRDDNSVLPWAWLAPSGGTADPSASLPRQAGAGGMTKGEGGASMHSSRRCKGATNGRPPHLAKNERDMGHPDGLQVEIIKSQALGMTKGRAALSLRAETGKNSDVKGTLSPPLRHPACPGLPWERSRGICSLREYHAQASRNAAPPA